MKMQNVADLVGDDAGRTYREINNAVNHSLEVGQLVQINDDESESVFEIEKLVRDCDGTPLYCVASNLGAYSRESLIAVK